MDNQEPPHIAVRGRIYALPDLWDGKDDWTGVTGTAERKKRQNRLNQRAYRRRKKLEAMRQPDTAPGSGRLSEDRSTPSSTSPIEASASTRRDESIEEDVEIIPRIPEVEYGIREPHPNIDDKGSLFQTSPHKVARIRNLIRQAYQNAMLRAPRPESLQQLIRINVTIAFARNAERMGFPIEGLCYDHYISPFNNQGPGMDERWNALPESLRPTALSKSVIHHPWIDLFPFPRMRDNMLRAIEAGFDDDLLCVDVMEIYHADKENRPTLMVWGESWDHMGWEASAPFLKKWGWLLDGCPEILQSTNMWREQRGEKRFT